MSSLHLALHGAAIKKHASAAEIGEIVAMDAEDVKTLLDEAVANGRAMETQGKYMLTPAAQIALRSEYSRLYATERASEAMNTAYDQFEKINNDLKQLITDWQTKSVGGESITNDHSDQGYDDKIIDRLGTLHERFEPVLKRMANELPRLSVYGDLLVHALEKSEDGDIDWVSDARKASYHTVWFEMHEDLLRVLDRERDE